MMLSLMSSVALSADGNTALVGGDGDNSGTGAAWVFIRSGGTWTQQGPKLIGTGTVGQAEQGVSVALSADGSTALIGGYEDNSYTGAAWVYVRSGSIWTQQGSKLVGTGAVGQANQGFSVSLSADGNTAIVGGYKDNNDTGAAWVYTRSGVTWTQQGSKLVGTGVVDTADQGFSVALSADGNAAIVGGTGDNNHTGAAWIYASGITGISELPVPSAIRLYPNPNSGTFTLATDNWQPATLYTITDMLGNVVRLGQIKSDNQLIDLAQSAEGVYTLTVKGAQPVRFVVVR